MQEVKSEELLTPLTDPAAVKVAVHGTYLSQKATGLSRMGRNHIHLASEEPQSTELISGMRASCEVLLYIDLASALADNIPFFLSANRVVLTSGIDGILPPRYFIRAVNRKTNEQLYP
eukprot:CAMPEP_0177637844 /NCGR_PEP_ID=MMETSP0447-20121125/5180_1 /TAXON_ID=0 /ORGANISM="Stygamoeba regulata, Strain BSH-02190019" /LENGTH=117 /DNA_ID=CAMNT_0019139783 /DNA_START=263 /DNA_END=617 /DNA_ORIENTATION=-